jgi:hypothetical protein
MIYFLDPFGQHMWLLTSQRTPVFPGTWYGKRRYRTVNWSTGLGIGLRWDNPVECRVMDWLTELLIGLFWDNSTKCRFVDWSKGM